MVGGFRCSLGHVWAPTEGHTPTACPVCGDTVILPESGEVPEPAFVLAVAAGQPAAGAKDPTLPPDSDAPPTAAPAPRPDLPSFSSLVGMPEPDSAAHYSDPAADLSESGERPVELADDVVPFGGETIDAAAPRVPGFEIVREVGRGGMGVVYHAKQVSLNRPVALKMILAGSHAGPSERERFRREAEAVATLQNPHIVQIFEIGEAHGQLYLALEYVDGGSLAHHLKGTPWPARDAAELIELLARAVHYAHSQGVVHRDLKPGNILLSAERGTRNAESKTEDLDRSGSAHSALRTSRSAFPKITDFGLAKRLGDSGDAGRTKTGAVMGTPSYIAPEQASGKTRDIGPAADVYSLGAILYELLTGRPPFLGETPLDTVLQVLHDDPVPPKRLQPTVPRDLETICLKCLHKSAAMRYAGADTLADDLRRFLLGEPIKARPLSAWGRGVKWAQRHPSLAVLGAVTLLATVALVSSLSMAYAHVRDAVTQKEAEAEAAREARAKEIVERLRAERFASEIEQKRKEAEQRNEELRREGERTRRAAFALQLAQIAAMCERDPRRARDLLEDETRCPPELRDFTWAYLHRMCQREERVYADHPANDPLHAVAFSPTGTLVATAGNAGDVRVWDPRTGRTWAVLAGHSGRVTGVAFSPDGGAVATCGADHSVRLWELPLKMLDDARGSVHLLTFLGEAMKPLNIAPAVTLGDAHAGEVNCVAFSPDGRSLVSGGEDGYLRWWDLSGWRVANPALAAAGAAGPLGVTLARASAGNRGVRYARGVTAHVRDEGLCGVRSVAFAASGAVLVSGGADRAARVWAADGANLILTVANYTDAVRGVAVTPDGKTIATVSNGNVPAVRLIDVESGRDLRRLTGHTAAIYAVAISPDGELLASTGFDHSVRLWGVEDGQERGVLHGHELAASAVAFAPDRRTVVSAGLDSTARVWQTTARPNDPADTFRDATLAAAALSAEGTAFLGGDERGRVELHRSDLLPGRIGAPPGTTPFVFPGIMASTVRGKVKAAALTPDGQTAVVSTEEGGLFVWRVLRMPGRPAGPGLPLHRAVPLRVPRPVYAMAVDPTGRWLATLDSDGVRVWDLRSVPAALSDPRGAVPEGPGLVHPVRGARELVFNAAGNRMAVAVGAGVRVIDFPTGQVLADVPKAHPAPIEAMAFGRPDGSLLATADHDGLVRVWAVGPDGLMQQAELAGHTGPVFSVAFSPDGRTLASGGDDRTVLLWDPVTGQERATLTGHADRVLRVQFLPDSSALLTVGRDGAVKRWRSAGGALPAAPPLPPPSKQGFPRYPRQQMTPGRG